MWPILVDARSKAWVCAPARLLALRVRSPSGSWISVPCECYLLPGRGLWVGLITRPEDSHRVGCVLV